MQDFYIFISHLYFVPWELSVNLVSFSLGISVRTGIHMWLTDNFVDLSSQIILTNR